MIKQTTFIFILLTIILNISSLKAQLLTWDTSYNTSIPVKREELITRPTTTKVCIDYENSKYYFKLASPTNQFLDLNDFIFYSLDLKSNSVDSFVLKIPDNYLKNMRPQDVLGGFVCNNKYAILELYGSQLLLFKSIVANKFEFESEIRNSYCLREDFFTLKNNKFLLANYYDYHPLDCKYKFVLTLFDPVKKSFDKKVIIDNIEGIEFSKNVHKWIDISTNRILVCRPSEMKLEFFDYELNLINNIELRDVINIKSTKSNSNERIEKAYLINDTTVLLSIILNDISVNHRKVIILNMNNQVIFNETLDIRVRQRNYIDKTKEWESILYSNTPEYVIYNNKVIELNPVFRPIFWGESTDNNKLKIHEYSKSNPKSVGITIYSLPIR